MSREIGHLHHEVSDERGTIMLPRKFHFLTLLTVNETNKHDGTINSIIVVIYTLSLIYPIEGHTA